MKRILFLLVKLVGVTKIAAKEMENSKNLLNRYSLDEICNSFKIEINNRSFVAKFFEINGLRVGTWDEEAESKLTTPSPAKSPRFNPTPIAMGKHDPLTRTY